MRTPAELGVIQSIDSARVRISLTIDPSIGVLIVNGKAYRVGQLGSFVKVALGTAVLYGVVLSIGAGERRSPDGETSGLAWIDAELIGESDVNGTFKRGISQHPSVGDRADVVSEADLARIYGFGDAGKYVPIGAVVGAESLACSVDGDRLVNRHSFIVGATGSGKSTTVSVMLRKLTDPLRFPAARVLLIDMHGEYATALRDRASIFRVGDQPEGAGRSLYIPFWALEFSELSRICFGDLDESGATYVRDLVAKYRREVSPESTQTGWDVPLPFSINKLWLELYNTLKATHTIQGSGQTLGTIAYEADLNGNLQKGDAWSVTPPVYKAQEAQRVFLAQVPFNGRRQIDLLTSRLRDDRFAFLLRPGPYSVDQDGKTDRDLRMLLEDWLGNECPISIIDLSGTPLDVVNEVVGALLRITYEALFWSRNLPEGGRERPLLIVLEEAHSYLSDAGSSAARAVNRIVREGRKYGVGCMIVSQRPSDIVSSILSQCGTAFCMRMSSNVDRAQIANSVPDGLGALMALLPSLRTGEMIAVGEAVSMPVRVEVPLPPPPERPDSEDPVIYSTGPTHGWNVRKVSEDYGEVVSAWFAQSSRIAPRAEVHVEKINDA
jgi:hypothetical protein